MVIKISHTNKYENYPWTRQHTKTIYIYKCQEALQVPCNNNERANEPKTEEEKNHPIPWKTRKIVQDSLLPNTKKEKTTITSSVVDPVSPSSSPEPSEFGVSRTNSSHMLLYRNCSVRSVCRKEKMQRLISAQRRLSFFSR